MVEHGAPHGTRVPLPTRGDAVTAALLAVVVLVGTALVAGLQESEPFGWPTVVAIVLVAAVWSWHRVAPGVSAVLVAVLVSGYLLGGQPFGPIQIVVVLACFAVARYRSLRVAGSVCAAAALALGAALWTRLTGEHAAATVAVLLAWPGVFVVVPALTGALLRTRAEAADRERAELLARGAYEERLRVAKEVHDIAGHGFAVVAMQAGVALTVLDEEPAQARVSLDAIRTSSELALHELQATLDTFDRDVPTAGDIPSLVGRVRAGGLPVSLTVTGHPEGLAPQVSVVVYRLVQEALTNVIRHAGPTTAEIVIDFGARQVSASVHDGGRSVDASAESHTREGRGLRGLRERVEHLHGTFDTGNRAEGGFTVHATIPNTGQRR